MRVTNLCKVRLEEHDLMFRGTWGIGGFAHDGEMIVPGWDKGQYSNIPAVLTFDLFQGWRLSEG